MLSSLQCGLRMVPREAEAVLFSPVDHPNVDSATVDALARAFREHRAPVTVPSYRGKRGHPVCIGRPVVEELLALPVTAQAVDVIHRYGGERQLVDVNDPGVITDVDDPEAYRALVGEDGGEPRSVLL